MTFLKQYGYRCIVVAGAMSVVSLWAASESRAFFGFFQRRWDTAAAMYGGTTCGAPVTANYLPQTCYRVQYCPAPVTTYRPVTTCDPCTGCQTTCLRPITCYRLQPQYVPVASYRIQYSPLQPACAAPATTYYSSTAPSVVPAAGCTSCGGVTPAAAYLPSTSAPQLPVTTQYAPSTTYAPAGGYPSGSTLSGSASMMAPSLPPTYGVPANVAPSYSTPSYSAPTYAAPATPSYGTTPGYTTTPSYTPSPAYAVVPAPTLPADASVAGAAIVPPLTPVPNLSGSNPAAPSPSTTTVPGLAAPTTSTSNYAAPTYANPGYSSGLPATRAPVPAPSAAPYSSGIVPPTPAPPPTPSGTSPTHTLRPIPDPEINREGPRLGPTSSTPNLIDPEDKTAMAWPRSGRGGYVSIASLHEAVPSKSAVDVGRFSTVESSVRLGPPAATVPAPNVTMPMFQTPGHTIDADGWRRSDR